ncbi:hypothetical protein ACFL1Q_01030 [Patescibacteria group bacterium]
MPMDPKYEDLELDIVEARGAGRVWQEMAKNPALPGSKTAQTFPNGIPRKVLERKMKKTKERINAEITQVTRREREG